MSITLDDIQETTEPASIGDPTPVRVERLYRLSLEQYHRLAESGVFDKEPVVLIEGLLVAKMTINRPHVIATEAVREFLSRSLPVGWHVATQSPISLDDSRSEPEPDVQVARGSYRDYQDRHPGQDDLALVVEVAETSLIDDRTIMKQVYARSTIPEYWILNLPARSLEVYTDPTGPHARPDYRSQIILSADEVVPFFLDGREVARIAVNDLLP